MTRKEIITELKKFFDIKELTCNHTYPRWGERGWQFLRTEYLHNLLVIRRDILKKSMVCNAHASGTHQRGLRCNICQLVKDKSAKGTSYLSAHVLGAGGDFTIDGGKMTAEEARRLIDKNQQLLPYPIRMEAGVSWLHFDCYDGDMTQKVTYFTD